jgi:hypothetical protein
MLQKKSEKAILPNLPFLVPSNHALIIHHFGHIKKTDKKKYWRRNEYNKVIHPIPIGYRALISIYDHHFQMEIKENDLGPVYQVRNVLTNDLFSGSNYNEPWQAIYKKFAFFGTPIGSDVCI